MASALDEAPQDKNPVNRDELDPSGHKHRPRHLQLFHSSSSSRRKRGSFSLTTLIAHAACWSIPLPAIPFPAKRCVAPSIKSKFGVQTFRVIDIGGTNRREVFWQVIPVSSCPSFDLVDGRVTLDRRIAHWLTRNGGPFICYLYAVNLLFAFFMYLFSYTPLYSTILAYTTLAYSGAKRQKIYFFIPTFSQIIVNRSSSISRF